MDAQETYIFFLTSALYLSCNTYITQARVFCSHLFSGRVTRKPETLLENYRFGARPDDPFKDEVYECRLPTRDCVGIFFKVSQIIVLVLMIFFTPPIATLKF